MRLATTVAELPDRRSDHPHVARRGKLLHHLVKCGVRSLPQNVQNEGLMGVEHGPFGLPLLGRPNVAFERFSRPQVPTVALPTEKRAAA